MTGTCVGMSPLNTFSLSERGQRHYQGPAAGGTGRSGPPSSRGHSGLLLLEEPKAWEARHGMKQKRAKGRRAARPQGLPYHLCTMGEPGPLLNNAGGRVWRL